MRSELAAGICFGVGMSLTVLGNWFVPKCLGVTEKAASVPLRVACNVVGIAITFALCRRLAAGPSLSDFPELTPERQDLSGKTVLVTGAAAGIGKFTALQLALRGATVVLGCRSLSRSREAETQIRREVTERFGGRDVADKLKIVSTLAPLDVESFASVRNFAKAYLTSPDIDRLDILVNNAGIIPDSTQRFAKPQSDDHHNGNKYELAKMVNVLGPMLLTELLGKLVAKSNGRIVNVGSWQHTQIPRNIDVGQALVDLSHPEKPVPSFPLSRYALSKLANAFQTAYARKRFNVTAAVLHPGFVTTTIMEGEFSWAKPFMPLTNYILTKTSEEGATTSLYLCMCPAETILAEWKQVGAMLVPAYFSDCRPDQLSEHATNAKNYETFIEWAHPILQREVEKMK